MRDRLRAVSASQLCSSGEGKKCINWPAPRVNCERKGGQRRGTTEAPPGSSGNMAINVLGTWEQKKNKTGNKGTKAYFREQGTPILILGKREHGKIFLFFFFLLTMHLQKKNDWLKK